MHPPFITHGWTDVVRAMRHLSWDHWFPLLTSPLTCHFLLGIAFHSDWRASIQNLTPDFKWNEKVFYNAFLTWLSTNTGFLTLNRIVHAYISSLLGFSSLDVHPYPVCCFPYFYVLGVPFLIHKSHQLLQPNLGAIELLVCLGVISCRHVALSICGV